MRISALLVTCVLSTVFSPFPSVAVDEFRALVGADLAHAQGVTGSGVVVAIVDSGIDTDHPDLIDDIVGQKCFCNNTVSGGCCIGGQIEADTAEDDLGHGTFMAGVITSLGSVAPRGIAPDASIVAIKVINSDGKVEIDDVRLALQWILDERPDVDVVNLSLGVTGLGWSGYCDSVDFTHQQIKTIIDALRARGAIVVAATGNDGADAVAVPACLSNVVAVGAVCSRSAHHIHRFGRGRLVAVGFRPRYLRGLSDGRGVRRSGLEQQSIFHPDRGRSGSQVHRGHAL